MPKLAETNCPSLNRYLRLLSLCLLFCGHLAKAQLPHSFQFGTELSFQKIYDLKKNNSSELILATENGFYKFNGQKFLQVPSAEGQSINEEILYLDKSDSGTIYGKTIDGKVYEVKESANLLLSSNWERTKSAVPYYYSGYFYYLSDQGDIIAISSKKKDTIVYDLPDFKFIANQKKLLYVDSNYFFYEYIQKGEVIKIFDRFEKRYLPKANLNNRVGFETVTFQNKKYLIENSKSKKNKAYVLEDNTLKRIAQFDAVLEKLILIRSEQTKSSLALYGFNGLVIFNDLLNEWITIDTTNIITGAVFLSDSSVWYSTLNEGLFFVPNIYSQSYGTSINFKHLTHKNGVVFITDESDKLYRLKNNLLTRQAQFPGFAFINRNPRDSLLIKSESLDFYSESKIVKVQKSNSFNKVFCKSVIEKWSIHYI